MPAGAGLRGAAAGLKIGPRGASGKVLAMFCATPAACGIMPNAIAGNVANLPRIPIFLIFLLLNPLIFIGLLTC